MKKILPIVFFSVLVTACTAFGQKWEVGAGVGGSFYTTQDYKNAAASAKAGLSDGLAASVWLGNNSSRLVGGELRYDYEATDLHLSSGASSASFGAQTHAFHYDLLLHFTPRASRVRPFVAAGGGVKLYRGTGTEAAFQPLSSFALLTKTNDTKGLLSVGAGIKVAITHGLQLRLDAHDYVTPFPTKVIAPALGASTSGWLQDFVAMAGLSITF
ncbi:MAG: outer membrane beta-barrel protein [Bryobacteraceae bacterium]